MTGAISFNTNSFQTYNRATRVGIITEGIDFASISTKNLSMYGVAHSNRSVVPFVNYPSKAISIKGTISGSSKTDLDSRLDAFRGYLVAQEKNLDINFNGATRRFIATVTASDIQKSENGLYATFTVQFICTIPFGMDTATTTALNASGRTNNAYTDSYTFLGNAPVQLPIVTITLTAVSASGAQQLFWGNNDTGQSITLTRNNWTSGDVVVIDCENRRITVNGVDVDFAGAFPEFTPGAHNMIYGDTFTSRTMTENVVYYKRYM